MKHVEYKGEIMELSASLLQLPAGGQVLLSDTTFQRIGGRLHEVKLPALQLQRPRTSVDGPRGAGGGFRASEGQLKPKADWPRPSLEGRNGQASAGQSRASLQGWPEQSSEPCSRRSSVDSKVKLMVNNFC